jgi:acyl carrier protein
LTPFLNYGSINPREPLHGFIGSRQMGIQEKVVKVVAEQLGKDEAEVGLDKPFTELGSDSLDRVEIIMTLEDEFGLEIPDYEADGIISAQTAIDYVTPRVKS